MSDLLASSMHVHVARVLTAHAHRFTRHGKEHHPYLMFESKDRRSIQRHPQCL